LTFNISFTVELLLRLLAYKVKTFKQGWNWLDIALVTANWCEFFKVFSTGLDPMVLRLLRLCRLIRLAKVLKAFKSSHVFDTFSLLLTSIQSSLSALLWSFSFLWFVQVFVGVVLCQILDGYINNESEPVETRQQVFKYFGTFQSGMLTMFERSLGNWVVTCRVLVETVSEWYGVFYIFYRCCFMFAIMKVITAVFIAETSRVAASDGDLAMLKSRENKKHIAGRSKRSLMSWIQTGVALFHGKRFIRYSMMTFCRHG